MIKISFNFFSSLKLYNFILTFKAKKRLGTSFVSIALTRFYYTLVDISSYVIIMGLTIINPAYILSPNSNSYNTLFICLDNNTLFFICQYFYKKLLTFHFIHCSYSFFTFFFRNILFWDSFVYFLLLPSPSFIFNRFLLFKHKTLFFISVKKLLSFLIFYYCSPLIISSSIYSP